MTEPTLAFVWDNFGPSHLDRLDSTSEALAGRVRVVGIELFEKSHQYGWDRQPPRHASLVTLFEGDNSRPPGGFRMAAGIVSACRKIGARTVFLCGHGLRGIFLAAVLLRLLGIRVIAMTDSKFDDKPRSAVKEFLKSFYYLPYNGCLTASRRGEEYLNFLGMRGREIRYYYDNIDIAKIRMLAGAAPAPDGEIHGKRDFLCVARYTEKKNHARLLEAFALLVHRGRTTRRLLLCGSGSLEAPLREQAARLGIADRVDFTGWENAGDIARRYARALCLLLPSVEEQFGIVVLEALAMGVPVIVSDAVGARDLHVRAGVNGFVVASDNPEGMAFFMEYLERDEATWQEFARRAAASSATGDISAFVESVVDLSEIALPQRPS